MAIDLKGRVAIVTGAGNGLGREHALLLARHGAKVVVNDPGASVSGSDDDRGAAQKVVDEIKAIGGEAVASLDSVAEFAGAQKIINDAVESFGRLDILVNNAGILRDKSFSKMDMMDFEKVVGVHFFGTVYCTKAAWPIMMQQKYGRIVVTTSGSGTRGAYGQSNYGAAKMGVLGLMNCLAIEGEKSGVLINAISPVAATRMTEGLMPPGLDKYMTPAFISPAVAWLCSDRCTSSGLIVNAIAGYFSRVKFFESEGVQFDPAATVTVEMFDEAFSRIQQLDNAHPLGAGSFGPLEARLKAMGRL